MLQKLDLNQDHVLGFRIKGKLDFDSFTRSSRHLPKSLKQNGDVSILLEVPDPDGMEFYEMWKSIRYALAHFRHNIGDITNIAIVSDARWLHRAPGLDYKVLAGTREKVFNSGAKNKAVQWINKREAAMVA